MPGFIRVPLILAALCGLAYAAMWALVAYVEPQPREISQPIPAHKLQGK